MPSPPAIPISVSDVMARPISLLRSTSRPTPSVGRCQQRHRAVEFHTFLDQVEAVVPAELEVHMVLDNAATHKAPMIRNWLVKRLRWHLHFTPTSNSAY